MKNKTLIVFILFLIVIIGYESYIFYEGNYCDSKTNNYSDQYQNDSIVEEQKENVSKNETKVENFDEEKIKEENLQANEFLGTFEFTDKSNNVWVLIVKADETATIKNKDGKSTAYASWYKYNTMRYVHFSCSDRAPMITFPVANYIYKIMDISVLQHVLIFAWMGNISTIMQMRQMPRILNYDCL